MLFNNIEQRTIRNLFDLSIIYSSLSTNISYWQNIRGDRGNKEVYNDSIKIVFFFFFFFAKSTFKYFKDTYRNATLTG